MKVKMNLQACTCTITREDGDSKFRASGWGAGESRLLCHVKNILNARGYDLIKKRMSKDGHMVDDNQLYLRTRSPRSKFPHIYISSSFFALRDASEDFNKNGEVVLTISRDVYNKYPKGSCHCCGNDEFYARQRCYVDVVVDQNNNFLRNEKSAMDNNCSDADTPYGPFVCTGCAAEFSTMPASS